MKIAFVLDDGLDSVDGVQQYVLTLGKWLTTNGHDVHYIVGQTKRTDIANVHSLATNVQVRFNKNRLAVPVFTSNKRIARLLRTEQFDVLHVQMPYSPQYAGQIIRHAPSHTAIVGTFHILPYGKMQAYGARLLGLMNQRTIRRFSSIVSVSPAAQAFARGTMGIRSSVVPNAVNLAQFNAGTILSKYDDSIQTIVFLGRLVERKGCMELLQAVHYLVQNNKFKNRRLVLCGAGPLGPKIKAFIKTHNLDDFIECTGKITEDQKPDYLASADLAVFPSKSGESFGIVLVEAIASGARVTLGGDNPGYRYVLSEREEVLVNPRNTAELADKIDSLLNDSTKSNSLGTTQRNDIKQFDVTTVGSQLHRIYAASIAKASHKLDNE